MSFLATNRNLVLGLIMIVGVTGIAACGSSGGGKSDGKRDVKAKEGSNEPSGNADHDSNSDGEAGEALNNQHVGLMRARETVNGFAKLSYFLFYVEHNDDLIKSVDLECDGKRTVIDGVNFPSARIESARITKDAVKNLPLGDENDENVLEKKQALQELEGGYYYFVDRAPAVFFGENCSYFMIVSDSSGNTTEIEL